MYLKYYGIKNGLEEKCQIDMTEKYNKEIYNNYRKAYCSRVAYVIGSNKRIVDKFDITDWKNFLPKHVSLNASESKN